MRMPTGALLSIAALALSGGSVPVLADAPQQPPLQVIERTTTPAIVATGMGEVAIAPNIAYVNLGVETQNADSSKAVVQNAGKMEQVMKAVRAFGIADKDIQTSNYSIYQTVEGDPKNPRRFYTVNNSVRITVRKLADVGRIIDGATQIGANAANGVQFDADEETKTNAYDTALEKAVNMAARKAKTMARAAGTATVNLLELSESGPDVSVPLPKLAMARADFANTPISGGELTVRATVTARYSLVPPGTRLP